jgi:hypothetical protein
MSIAINALIVIGLVSVGAMIGVVVAALATAAARVDREREVYEEGLRQGLDEAMILPTGAEWISSPCMAPRGMEDARAEAMAVQKLTPYSVVTWYVPRLGGVTIYVPDEPKYRTRAEAVEAARAFKARIPVAVPVESLAPEAVTVP